MRISIIGIEMRSWTIRREMYYEGEGIGENKELENGFFWGNK